VKIILSRKGFDSRNGGYPSPVLPDGKMLSLPIPIEGESLSYDAISAPEEKSYAKIIEELGAGVNVGNRGAHLDPDLMANVRGRMAGWRPAFGQCGAAGSHLDNCGVSEGDVFLFFGWFQHTETVAGRLSYCSGINGFHVIFGYMEIGAIVRSNAEGKEKVWLLNHPHAKLEWANDRIYVAAPNLSFHPALPGGGVFEFDERLRLTKKEESRRSRWNLDPRVFRNVEISYHSQASWKDGHFQSAGRGQEFVINANEGVIQWASDLIKNSCLWSN